MDLQVRALLGGGIGSGKSAAAEVFARLGAAVISADAEARDVLAPGEPAALAVARRWPGAVGDDGVIDRGVLADFVFRDPAELRELEAITHPLIVARVVHRVAESGAPVVLVEIPLPGSWFGEGWLRIVVDAPDDVRVGRLLERGMTAEEISLRMAAQPSRDQWLAVADLVIDNGGDRERLEAECRRVWAVLAEGGRARTPR